MTKTYYTYNQVHKLVRRTAKQMIAMQYQPDLLVAIGTGGYIPARILRNFVPAPIYALNIATYEKDRSLKDTPELRQAFPENFSQIKGKKILIVDDLDDTRTTLSFCISELLKYEPSEIGVFVIHQKRKEKSAQFPVKIDNIFVGEIVDDNWINYPWEALDIDEHDKLSGE